MSTTEGASMKERAAKCLDCGLDYSAFPLDMTLRSKFKRLALEWRTETGHLSSLPRKLMHPAYQQILAMGHVAVSFIVEELRDNGGHWFAALQFLTGENPAATETTTESASKAWIAWAIAEGYVADAK